MIEIDGSLGEGGGQVLRTALKSPLQPKAAKSSVGHPAVRSLTI